jgi:hypothetical protein
MARSSVSFCQAFQKTKKAATKKAATKKAADYLRRGFNKSAKVFYLPAARPL